MWNIGAEKLAAQLRVSISQMKEHDLLEVVEIEEASGLSRWGWEAYHAELEQGQDTIMLVASAPEELRFEEIRILGFIAARLAGEELHINNMAVRDEWRQQGIGALLLGAALEEGLRRGARNSFLEVRASNTAAQALYSKFGFKAASRRTRYYTNPTEDAIVMAAALF